MRFKVLLLSFVLLVFAQDGIERAKQAGQTWGRQAQGAYNEKQSTNQKLQEPLKRESGKVIGVDNTAHSTPRVFCEDSQARTILRVRTSSNEVVFEWSSNFGSIDRSHRVQGPYYCAEGFCQYYNPSSMKYEDCRVYRISGGNLFLDPAPSLTACVQNPTAHDPATISGGFLAQLLESYRNSGKKIVVSNTRTEGNQVIYDGVEQRNCRSIQSNPIQSQYMSNPYKLNDYAIYYYLTCEQSDPSCKAIKQTLKLEDRNLSVCYIERQLGLGANVCAEGAKMFPDGYSYTGYAKIPMCGSGPQDIEKFSGMFWLECVNGRWNLKGVGYWGGYSLTGQNCKSDVYPPPTQISVNYRFGENYSENVGVLYVSGGNSENLTGSCIALPVRVQNRVLADRNVLSVYVNGADQCGQFTFSYVTKGGDDGIVDGCRQLQEQGCKVWNEYLIDVNGKEYQLIRNGQVVQAYKECDDVVWDDVQKKWVSGNCPIPPTCKVVGGKTECRHWWKKRREYKCEQRNQDMPSIQQQLNDKVRTITATSKYENGTLSYVECSEGSQIQYCSSPYSLRGAMCVFPPQCDIGGYSSARKRCENTPQCPQGSTFNPHTNRCEIAGTPHCPSGTYNPTTRICETQPRLEGNAQCGVVHHQEVNFLERGEGDYPYTIPNHPYISWGYLGDPRSFDTFPVPGWTKWEVRLWGKWHTLVCRVFPQNDKIVAEWRLIYYGYPLATRELVRQEFPLVYSSNYTTHEIELSSCVGRVCFDYVDIGYICECVWYATSTVLRFSYRMACPEGFTLQGNLCVKPTDFTCPEGFVYVGSGICATTAGMCPTGYYYDSQNKVCWKDVSCPAGGEFSPSTDRCETPANIQPCQGQRRGHNLHLPSSESSCLKQCVVKRVVNGKREYDIKACEGDVCPLSSGESIVSTCQCDNMSGFGITAGTLGMVINALRDWECK